MRTAVLALVLFAFFAWDMAKNNGRYMHSFNMTVADMAYRLDLH
jgi:hypothetical protein